MVLTPKQIWIVIIATFIFLYSMNIMGIGEFLPLLTLPIIAYKTLSSKLSKWFFFTQFILFSFLLIYCFFATYHNYYSYQSILGRFLFPQILMIIGYYIAGYDSSKNLRSFWILLLLVFGSTLYGILSLVKSVILYGSFDNVIRALGGRMIQDLWNTTISATVFNASVSLGLSFLGLAFIRNDIVNKKGKLLNVAFLILFISSIYTSVTLGNRTGILIVIVSLFTVFLAIIKFNIKIFIKLFLGIFSLYLIKILTFNLNLFGIKNHWENSLIYTRLKSSNIDDPRFEAWKVILSNFHENLMGGRQIDINLKFVHNLWLDVFYDAGLIAFIFLILFTSVSFISLFIFLRLEVSDLYKGLVVALYTSFFITFIVEPILQGFIVYFTFFCFLLGIIQRKIVDSNKIIT